MPSQQPEIRAASSRARLLAAAKRLFAAHGYEQSATSAIAREAGTSESQLMRYFGGKAGLLDALFDDAWVQLNARVARAVRATSGNRERLLAAIHSLIGALARDRDLTTLMLFEGRRIRGEKPRVRVSRGYLLFADTIAGFVRNAQTAGELDPTLDAQAVTSALLGATEAMFRDRLLAWSGTGRRFAEREIRRTLETILDGMARPRTTRIRQRTKR